VPVIQGEAKIAGTVQPGEEKAREGSHQCVQIPDGGARKTETGSSLWHTVNGQQLVVTNRDTGIPFKYKKKVSFIVRLIKHRFLTEAVESPSLDLLKT